MDEVLGFFTVIILEKWVNISQNSVALQLICFV